MQVRQPILASGSPSVGPPAVHVSARRCRATWPCRAGRRRYARPCRTRRGPSSADRTVHDLAECPVGHHRRGAHRRPRRSVPVDPAGRHADRRDAVQVPRMHGDQRRTAAAVRRRSRRRSGRRPGAACTGRRVVDRQPPLDEPVQAGALEQRRALRQRSVRQRRDPLTASADTRSPSGSSGCTCSSFTPISPPRPRPALREVVGQRVSMLLSFAAGGRVRRPLPGHRAALTGSRGCRGRSSGT